MAGKSDQPPHYAVQCAKGKGWKTLAVDLNRSVGEVTFREVIKIKPKGTFRLIRLEHNAEAEYGGREYNWRLLKLHDPHKRFRAQQTEADKPGWWQRWFGERIPLPMWLYGLAVLAGLVLAVVLYIVYGPPLDAPPAPPPVPPPGPAQPAPAFGAGIPRP